jgi:hypothetical protein
MSAGTTLTFEQVDSMSMALDKAMAVACLRTTSNDTSTDTSSSAGLLLGDLIMQARSVLTAALGEQQ